MSYVMVRRDVSIQGRWPAARDLVLVGSVNVVLGGLIAAITGPTGFELGSWTAAYLVLVGGVAQITLGGAQAWLAEGVPSRAFVTAQLVAWNASTAAIIAGTLVAAPVLTSIGGAALMLALLAALVGVRLAPSAPRAAVVMYRGVLLFVLLSAPVGLLLAWMRRG